MQIFIRLDCLHGKTYILRSRHSRLVDSWLHRNLCHLKLHLGSYERRGEYMFVYLLVFPK